jgi:predicted nucleotidyltransferase
MRFTINEIIELTAPIAEQYGIDSLYLFGSYARGNADENSDIDFRVDSGLIRDLFELGGLYSDLESILKSNIDLVMTEGLSADFLNEIRRDEVLVYGRQ